MKNFQIKILIGIFILGTLFWGCESLIYDDLKNCPQGIFVKFYSKTMCAEDSLFIGEVSSLTIFAFDQEGKLRALVEQKNVDLTQDYEALVPVSNGNYSLIAWAGVNDKFKENSFIIGVTSRNDVMLAINSADNIATEISTEDRIWHGESPVIFLPDPSEYGSLYKYTNVNLRELTNRIGIVLEFDQTTMKNYDPSKLEVTVSSANGIVNIDGHTPLNLPILTYPSIETKFDKNIGSWYYSMLDLKTGYSSMLSITYNGNNKKETIFNGDLISSILLKATEKGINLNCENDFTVKFMIKDYCAECNSPFNCAVYINNWLIYSYSTDLYI